MLENLQIQKASANKTATLLKVLVTSANGSRELEALLDTDADISTAEKEVSSEYVNSFNLL